MDIDAPMHVSVPGARAVVWACVTGLVSVPAGVLIRGHCCALGAIFGHVSVPAWGAECSAVVLA